MTRMDENGEKNENPDEKRNRTIPAGIRMAHINATADERKQNATKDGNSPCHMQYKLRV